MGRTTTTVRIPKIGVAYSTSGSTRRATRNAAVRRPDPSRGRIDRRIVSDETWRQLLAPDGTAAASKFQRNFVRAVTGGALIFGEKFISVLFSGLFYALILAGGTYFAQKRFRRTAARLEEHGQSLMFLRYPNVLPGSLSGVWQMGVATPSPSRIDFQPAIYDQLIPSGRSRALTGLGTTGPTTRSRPCRSTSRSSPWTPTGESSRSPRALRRSRRSWKPSGRHLHRLREQDPVKPLARRLGW